MGRGTPAEGARIPLPASLRIPVGEVDEMLPNDSAATFERAPPGRSFPAALRPTSITGSRFDSRAPVLVSIALTTGIEAFLYHGNRDGGYNHAVSRSEVRPMLARLQLLFLFLLLLVPGASSGDSLEVAYASVERMVTEGVLIEGGRRYLQGAPGETCNYAFIQNPRVSGSGERLSLRFLFAGSIGKEVAGKCVGRGDNFDVVVSGVPRYDAEAGEILLDPLEFSADNRLFDLFAPILESRLGPMLRLPLRQAIANRLATATSIGRVRIEDLTVAGIHVGESSVRLDASFRIAVLP
jgi:hypothetical protein